VGRRLVRTLATNQIVEPGGNTIDWLEDWLPDEKR
jgi:hypothetical protein